MDTEGFAAEVYCDISHTHSTDVGLTTVASAAAVHCLQSADAMGVSFSPLEQMKVAKRRVLFNGITSPHEEVLDDLGRTESTNQHKNSNKIHFEDARVLALDSPSSDFSSPSQLPGAAQLVRWALSHDLWRQEAYRDQPLRNEGLRMSFPYKDEHYTKITG
ncbi:hypothetical protein R1sor_020744 [Riccia sorocarpa]|uniref:Uncharacterized protein n=1 Tax=Riccia sorocarpa TaxID=122646 RepID=A0ABD3GF22_9MARC